MTNHVLQLFFFVLQGTAQRFALPALGRGRRSRPTGKMLRRRKLPEIAQTPQRRVHVCWARFSHTSARLECNLCPIQSHFYRVNFITENVRRYHI